MNKHERRLRRISATIAVVALVVAATGASAAQAAFWHRAGQPMYGTSDLTNYPGVGAFEMKLSKPNPVHIVCQAPSTYGITAKAWNLTQFETATIISGCKTYSNATGEHVQGCDQIGQANIILVGTGEKLATSIYQTNGKIIFDEECPVGVSLPVLIESMALEWPTDVNHPAAGIEHEMKGSGFGKLGSKPMTVTYSNNFQRYGWVGETWGWY